CGTRAIVSARSAGTISQPSCPVISFHPCAPLKMMFQVGFCRSVMLASGSITSAASTRSASSWARATAKLALTSAVLAELDALGIGVNLDHLELRPAHIGGKLLALEVGERFDVGVLGEHDEIGKGEPGAENP